MFNKRSSVDVIRGYVEHLVDTYGNTLWGEAQRQVGNDERAHEVWLRVFVEALRKINPSELERYDEAWLKQVLKHNVIIQSSTSSASALDVQIWATAEHEVAAFETADQTSCDLVPTVPPSLRTRASQVIRATAGLMEAEARHRGPRWTWVGTIATLLFGVIAVGYGLEDRFGHPIYTIFRHVMGWF